MRGHIQVAEFLLKEGACVDAADLYGYQVWSMQFSLLCFLFALTINDALTAF